MLTKLGGVLICFSSFHILGSLKIIVVEFIIIILLLPVEIFLLVILLFYLFCKLL